MAKRTKCLPCMSADIKQLIRDHYQDPLVNEALMLVEECPKPGEINFCIIQKRAPGPYALFIKECLGKHDLKGKPFGTAGKFMKECAIEYRKLHPKS